ncbi:kinase-like domain-containing protein [Entophlyctis helioformis]|nr:kinase-like domain-containing protein [Entophlyctis helioformis]
MEADEQRQPLDRSISRHAPASHHSATGAQHPNQPLQAGSSLQTQAPGHGIQHHHIVGAPLSDSRISSTAGSSPGLISDSPSSSMAQVTPLAPSLSASSHAQAQGGGAKGIHTTPSQGFIKQRQTLQMGGRTLGAVSSSISGSRDLDGDRKEAIRHIRSEDMAELDENYIIKDSIGQGAFGVVKLCEHKSTGKVYACKIVKKRIGSTSSYEQLQREVNVMKAVHHPNIVQLKEVFESPKKMSMIMEYCSGGELVQTVKKRGKCTEEEIRFIVIQLIEAVSYLHRHGIVHRDIKPENILLKSSHPADLYTIKVSDFGLACFADSINRVENVAGTPMYMAPEIVHNLGYNHSCDIWSIGVMFYLLLCDYQKDVELLMQDMIRNSKIEYPDKYWSKINPTAKNLCEMILRFDPAKRISAAEILRHPWTLGQSMESSQLNANVLDLMKSYNAERRLRRGIIAVIAFLRFMAPLTRSLSQAQPIASAASAPASTTRRASSSTARPRTASQQHQPYSQQPYTSGALQSSSAAGTPGTGRSGLPTSVSMPPRTLSAQQSLASLLSGPSSSTTVTATTPTGISASISDSISLTCDVGAPASSHPRGRSSSRIDGHSGGGGGGSGMGGGGMGGLLESHADDHDDRRSLSATHGKPHASHGGSGDMETSVSTRSTYLKTGKRETAAAAAAGAPVTSSTTALRVTPSYPSRMSEAVAQQQGARDLEASGRFKGGGSGGGGGGGGSGVGLSKKEKDAGKGDKTRKSNASRPAGVGGHSRSDDDEVMTGGGTTRHAKTGSAAPSMTGGGGGGASTNRPQSPGSQTPVPGQPSLPADRNPRTGLGHIAADLTTIERGSSPSGVTELPQLPKLRLPQGSGLENNDKVGGLKPKKRYASNTTAAGVSDDR